MSSERPSSESIEESQLWGWETFFDELSVFLRELNRQYEGFSEAYGSYAMERLEISISNVSRLKNHLEDGLTRVEQENLPIVRRYVSDMEELVSYLRSLSREFQDHVDTRERMSESMRYRVEASQSTGKGRPRFLISRDQLEYLRSLLFTWTEIATLIGVSRMTIFRRRQEFGMLEEPVRTLTDPELRDKLSEIRRMFPEAGEKMILGQLRSMGYQIIRARVRETLRSVDPINTALRWQGGITARRSYSVPGPNSLWHIDGHHKLIRWKIVTHAAIDGYSRMIVFMKCSNNNKATTVYHHFLEAILNYGLPSRVRSDQGRENCLVAQHMLEHRGEARGSMITGSSVHNQRIERLWKDMHQGVTKLFYRLFYYMEEQRILDCENNIHIYALHYIYIPRINNALSTFMTGWNNHSIRTEHGRSPLQLFVAGALRLRMSGIPALDFFENVHDEHYGIEEEGLAGDNENAVVIPESQFHLTDEQLHQLQRDVDPLTESQNHGIELYEATIEFIYNLYNH